SPADGVNDEEDFENSAAPTACGVAVACEENSCKCASPNNVIGGGGGGFICSLPSEGFTVQKCDTECWPLGAVACEPEESGSEARCCGPGSTNSETDCRPLEGVPATPNICSDATAPQCVKD